MPSGDANLKAVQIVTQRVSVEPSSRRSGAEPIGRDFADLVDAARATPEAESNAAAGDVETGDDASSDHLLISDLVEDTDTTTPAAFLVANAALADASQPVAGVLRHPGEAAASAPDGAPTDILVDTAGLFLPLDPSRPIETNATTHSTQFGALSWPPPESAASLHAAVASQQSTQGVVATNIATASADLVDAAEAGPGANRQSANLAATIGQGENASTQSGANPQSQNGQAQANPAPVSSASAQQAAPTLPASIETPPPAPTQPTSQAVSQLTAASAPAQSTPASAAQASAPPAALANAPSATIQIYNRIVERFDGRAQQFQIRLDPPELGRVNVRIEISSDNRVHAVLATHDSNALADLLRGQRALEQSLANAGLDLADEGITFELSDQNTNQSANRDETTRSPRSERGADPLAAAADVATESAPPPWARGRINIVA